MGKHENQHLGFDYSRYGLDNGTEFKSHADAAGYWFAAAVLVRVFRGRRYRLPLRRRRIPHRNQRRTDNGANQPDRSAAAAQGAVRSRGCRDLAGSMQAAGPAGPHGEQLFIRQNHRLSGIRPRRAL